jgi:hypothetical protein
MENLSKHVLTHDFIGATLIFTDYGDGTVGISENYKSGSWGGSTVSRDEARKVYAAWRTLGAYKPSEKVRLANKRGEDTYTYVNGQPTITFVDDWYDDGDTVGDLTPVGWAVERVEYLEKDATYKQRETPKRLYFCSQEKRAELDAEDAKKQEAQRKLYEEEDRLYGYADN